ncbi:uncharacterized protein L201_002266 [Kwoniella dendrophila CBS 6074]|uniref:Uncharacterized protein n=1 Tax=Kwoniella dendrophila CBS 6074 TaxID=1295534 RepID=A0AAX4JPT8_9TREE
MPQFPFLRSNTDKDRDKEAFNTSSSNLPSSPDSRSNNNTFYQQQQQPQQAPQFTHPFASSSSSPSINASSTTINVAPSNVASASAESPTSKYHPSRLLRRKASLNNKSNQNPLPPNIYKRSNSISAGTTQSNSASSSEPPLTPNSPRKFPPSSPRANLLPSSPRGFFFDSHNHTGNGERDKFSTYPIRRGSENSRVSYAIPLPSPTITTSTSTSNKRSAFVYNGKLSNGMNTEEIGSSDNGQQQQDVVIIPSSSNEGTSEDMSHHLNLLEVKSDISPPLSTSLPKVVDGGLGPTSGIGIFGKVANNNDTNNNNSNNRYIDNRNYNNDRDRYERPPTPPDSATKPFYPTALSPPRRPMPRSPKAIANSAQQQQLQQQRSSTPTSYKYNNINNDDNDDDKYGTPPSISMIQALSAVGGPSSFNNNNSNWQSISNSSPNLRQHSPSPNHHGEDNVNAGMPSSPSTPLKQRRGSEKPHKINAEWLARKPSLSSTSGINTPEKQRKHRPSLSVDQQSSNSRQSSSESPLSHAHARIITNNPSTPKRQGSLDDSPKIIDTNNNKILLSSTEESDTDMVSSDGEIGLNPRRRSIITTPSRDRSTPRKSMNGNGNGGGGNLRGYEVMINCINNKDDDGMDNEDEEIRWEIVIKKQSDHNHNQAFNQQNTQSSLSGPVQLSTSTNGVIAQAPLSASSINLSLNLDRPTGKLVFISFPMDIHATPTRRRRPSTTNGIRMINQNSNITSSPRSNNNVISSPSTTTTINGTTNPRPSTPPNQIQSNLIGGNSIGSSVTLTRTPSSRRKAPPPWPSPRTEKPISPPTSPRDVFTPKKGDARIPISTGTPSKMGVNGDLLNKVTRGNTP